MPSSPAPTPNPKRPPRAPRPLPEAAEQKLCGLNACLAVFHHRRDAIVRAYVSEARRPAAGVAALLRWCAKSRRAYHVVPDADLERLTQSAHHEGICLLVRRPPAPSFPDFLASLPATPAPCCLLLLENVGNPHNLGAIARNAAHFGAAGILLAGPGAMPSPAAYRTAEGGLETVPAVPLPEPLRALRALHAAGFTLVATSSHAAAPFQATAGGLPPRCVLLLGAEGEGLSPALAAAADRNVAIPGTGAVESINVACAAAVLLAEFWRRHRLAAGTGA